MRFFLNTPRFRNQPQHRFLCLENEHYPKKINTHINTITQINDLLKQRNSKRIYYKTIQLNQLRQLHRPNHPCHSNSTTKTRKELLA